MSESWLTVYYAKDPIEAQLLKGYLESQSVSVQLADNASIGGVGELPADALETPLRVSADQFEHARQLLKQYETRGDEVIYCPHCKETNYSNFDVCWSCGTDLVLP